MTCDVVGCDNQFTLPARVNVTCRVGDDGELAVSAGVSVHLCEAHYGPVLEWADEHP